MNKAGTEGPNVKNYQAETKGAKYKAKTKGVTEGAMNKAGTKGANVKNYQAETKGAKNEARTEVAKYEAEF